MINNSRGYQMYGVLGVDGKGQFGRFEGLVDGVSVKKQLNLTSKGFFFTFKGKRVYLNDIMELMI